MTIKNQDTTRSGSDNADETSQLRHQLSNLVKAVRSTIAHPARPEGLREAIAQSQELLR